MNSDQMLLWILLGLGAWNLKEVVSHGKKLAAIAQHLKSLPCSKGDCSTSTDAKGDEDE